MPKFILQWIEKSPIPAEYHDLVATSIAVAAMLFIALVAYQVTKRVIVRLITKLITKTSSQLDDVLLERRVFERLSLLAPSIVLYKLMPLVLGNYATIASVIMVAVAVYSVTIIALALDSIIMSVVDIYHTFPVAKRMPIQSFGQVARLLVLFVTIILIVSLVIGQSPLKLFAGLGAMTAVLMLVFKDPILGFVAGLQLSYNKMVSLGDWIDIPQHKASGDILEIGLTTVKVRNFDNTITTVPTQALINDSFKNWRGMQESGGRRIKRAIYIDVNSISFCDEERLKRYAKIEHIKEYIEQKQTELDQHNRSLNLNESLANGRRVTNVGTFRAYMLAYLRNHPQINQRLTVMVRQLAANDSGVPLEIYAFSADKNWATYEGIQADIFDHLFAVAAEFDLRIFQRPSGGDLATLGATCSKA